MGGEGGRRETIIVKGKRKGGPVAVDYTYMYNVIHVQRNLSCPVLNSGRIEYTTLLIRKKRKREGNFNIFIRLFGLGGGGGQSCVVGCVENE